MYILQPMIVAVGIAALRLMSAAGSDAAADTRAPGVAPAPSPPTPRPTARRKAREPQRGGIGVFPPPGTKPVKQGIIVPDDFELPPGYVRHYQTTDDGRRLPAILMFHPDYEFVDERGRTVPLPENRVVPPEMAPPGLPIEMLKVPEKRGAADPRS
jgi:hypothetical protein